MLRYPLVRCESKSVFTRSSLNARRDLAVDPLTQRRMLIFRHYCPTSKYRFSVYTKSEIRARVVLFAQYDWLRKCCTQSEFLLSLYLPPFVDIPCFGIFCEKLGFRVGENWRVLHLHFDE